MRAKASSRPAGFTLVEVMMAATILVVGFVGLIQAVTIGSETLDTARKQQIATQLVLEEIARLRSGAWTTIANLPATATITIDHAGTVSGNETGFALCNFTAAAGDDDSALLALARGFTCAYTRTLLRPTGATVYNVTFVEVVYTVTWTSNTGRIYRRTTETFFGMNGLHLSDQSS
jgi:prepilin-type N-terminal cleavage/methylation domain-containing protein